MALLLLFSPQRPLQAPGADVSIGSRFCTGRVVKHCRRLPGGGDETPPLETLKAKLNSLWEQEVSLWGALDRMALEASGLSLQAPNIHQGQCSFGVCFRPGERSPALPQCLLSCF